MVRVQAYMRKVFGTLTVDNEDGELCYQFQMAILELDLEDV